MTGHILETRSLKKQFGGFTAIDTIDLKIERGELRCLIGPNGAGKSTVFKLVIGVLAPTSGEIFFKEKEMSRLQSFERIRAGMSIKFQVPGIFRELETRHNLRIALQRRLAEGDIDKEIDQLLDLLDITSVASTLAGQLSHGQQQWLEIGMAVAMQPDLLLLDEPTAGMSPEETHKTGDLITNLNAGGMTIIVVEHDLTFVRQVAKKVTVLHNGRVFLEGSLTEIVTSEDVARIYLGKPS